MSTRLRVANCKNTIKLYTNIQRLLHIEHTETVNTLICDDLKQVKVSKIGRQQHDKVQRTVRPSNAPIPK